MRRSAVGAVLLLIGGLLVAVVPALRPTLIDGSAQALPIPGMPAVGDCVTEPVPYSSLWIGLDNPDADTVVYPALNIEPCAGPRYGEVAAVIPVPAAPHVDVSGGVRSTSDTNADRCLFASASYLGLDVYSAAQDAQWSPLIAATSLVVQPSPRQQAAGQSWLACVTYAQSADSPDLEETIAPYNGTLRNATTTGNQTDQLGYCGDQAALTANPPGSCARPHRYQQLAVTSTGNGSAGIAALAATCADTATTLIGRDLVTSGELQVVVTGIDSNGAPVDANTVPADVPPNTSLQCTIAAADDRLLANSIIGLTNRPIPWA